MVLREFDGTSMPLVFSWALKDYDALVANLARGSESTTSVRSWDIILQQQPRVKVKHEVDGAASKPNKSKNWREYI